MNRRDYKDIRELYVAQLDNNLQAKIKCKLIEFFKKELELNNEDLRIELELAMSSRVSDLEDSIDVKKILHEI